MFGTNDSLRLICGLQKRYTPTLYPGYWAAELYLLIHLFKCKPPRPTSHHAYWPPKQKSSINQLSISHFKGPLCWIFAYIFQVAHHNQINMSVLGYCRNMAVQHGGHSERWPAPPVDVKGSFLGNKNTMMLTFRWLYTNKNIIMSNIIFHFCQ